MTKLSIDQALQKAKSDAKKGKIEEAKKLYQAVLQAFPKNKRAQQGLAALNKPKQSANIQGPPQDIINQLINLYNQGQLTTAIEQANTLTAQYPEAFIIWNILGAANKGLGRVQAASEAFKKVIELNPTYDVGFNNLGVTLKDQGKLEEAIEAYNKALAINPDSAAAYNNMGNALQEQGKLEEAIETYDKAIAINPDFAEAYKNMGNAFKEQGKLEEAIEAYDKAIAINPDFAEAFIEIGIVLKGVIFKKPNRAIQNTIVSLLDKETYVRPIDIDKAAISLLKLEPTLQKHLQLTDGHVIENPLDVILDLHEFPLLMKQMSVCHLTDLQLERFFTKLRFSILSNISLLKEASPKLLGFQSALALQCFTNEYIHNHTEEEEEILQSLDASVKKGLKNKEQPDPQVILALASYKELNRYDWCNLLVVNDYIKEVFCRQVEEPNHEEELKQDFQILEDITNSISLNVRGQYEESPYPRWVNLFLPFKPFSILEVVDQNKLKLHDNKITGVEKPNILIAGCGTGQHSIGTAARFKGSSVLAIDLSLSSLAYAKRKTEELGIENISYMQADILDSEKLNKQFDIIESFGVLHHMDNPMAGWKILTDCLKPGGLMKLGLYSELARKHIVKIRQEISKAGIGSSDAAIKSFRKMVMTSNEDHHTLITTSPDFYSMSNLKDLLFHVQEHRFTIPQIQDCLSELGLKFCGFEPGKTVTDFKKKNTGVGDSYDLKKWHAYEEANPRAFARTYQFWCQKVD